MKTLILYFSATGNSLEVAKKMQKKLEGGSHHSVDIVSMRQVKPDRDLGQYDTIGFVYPCFFLSAPDFILKTIDSLDLPTGAFYFGVCTVNKHDGHAGAQLSQALEKKGCHLSYYSRLVMVGNYIMMYSPPKTEKAAKLLDKADQKLDGILDGIVGKQTRASRRRGQWFSTAYYGLFESHKTKSGDLFQVSEACVSCGICAKVCSFSNIEMIKGKPVWADACEHCTACIHWCPKEAVNYGRSTEKRRRYTHPQTTVKEIFYQRE